MSAVLAALLLAVLPAAAVTKGAEARCALCHPDVRVQFEKGIHHAEGIACTSCHGGDPSATSVEAAHRGGFKGRPRRRDVPALCASCHADAGRMRAYNLPADQHALYLTSEHGKALARGDEQAAVCTDCHGAHDILPSEDPRSLVAARNVPRTCAVCHADRPLMAARGLRADVFDEYAAGVHGALLLDQGNAAAPGCTQCHGSHGAAPPGVGDVDKVCGQCHATVRSFFVEGPHKERMAAAGLPECASCHDHHRVQRTGPEMLETICLRCHDTASEQAGMGARMKTLLTGSGEEIERASSLVEEAAAVPLYVEDYRARLQEARTVLLEASPAAHALDAARVEFLTERARAIGREVASEVDARLASGWWRRVGLLVFWFYLLLTVAILLRFRARAARGAEAGPGGGTTP